MSSLNLDMAKMIWRSALPKGCNKLVLQCFCHHLNDESGLSWPSISRVALMCGMSERTVQLHIRALQAAGILRARLRTGRTTRYSIHLDSLAALVFPAATMVLDADGKPVDNSEISAESVDNSAIPYQTPAVSAENLQENDLQPEENDIKPVENFTLTVDLTVFNSETTQSADAAPAAPVLCVIDAVNPKVLADFAAIRKSKRKGAVTPALLSEIDQQAKLAGLTLEQALLTCCEPNRRWARFEAGWLAAPGRASASATTPTPAAALWTPPVAKPATAEVVASGRERLATIRSKMTSSPALPAMPTSATDIHIAADAPPWAVAIVTKHRTGQPVSRNSLDYACAALKLDPAMLRRAAAATSTAARMH